MTIEEYKKTKKELEEKISHMLTDFVKENEVFLENIDFEYSVEENVTGQIKQNDILVMLNFKI